MHKKSIFRPLFVLQYIVGNRNQKSIVHVYVRANPFRASLIFHISLCYFNLNSLDKLAMPT